MKKKLVLIIFLLLPLVTDSFADDSQVMKAGFVVQNTSDSTIANIAIDFYNSNGTNEQHVNRTIDPQSSSLIDLDNLTELTPGWSGSAVISSNIPVVGVGWAETFSKYGKPEGIGWYNLPVPGTGPLFRVYVPQIRKDKNTGFGSNLWVQNTGTSDATIAVTYNALAGGGSYNSSCPMLAPGASLDTINSSCTTNLPDSFVGSAVVSSDQPIVIVANQSNTAKMTECLYNGVPGSEGDAQLFFPIVQNNYQGWYSSLTVQNMSSSTTQGNFEYYSDCGNATCDLVDSLSSASITPGYGYVFTPVTNSFSGYGYFSSDQPFGSVARVWNDLAKTAYCYNGFGGGTPVPAENTWYIPSVNSDSRIVVKNTSGTTVGTISISWLGTSNHSQMVNLSANDKQVIPPAVPTGWSGSGVVQSTVNLPLAIVVQNSQLRGNDQGAYNADGINKGATELYVPLVRKAKQFQSTIWKVYNPAILKCKDKDVMQ